MTGTSVSIDAPPNNAGASSANFTLFSYTINASCVLSTTLAPGSLAGTEVTGPRAEQTYVDQVPAQSGQMDENARSIVLTEPAPTIENVNSSNGDSFARLCNRSRVLILTSP